MEVIEFQLLFSCSVMFDSLRPHGLQHSRHPCPLTSPHLPELFHILKYDAVKVLHLICQGIWKTQQWLQDWKRSVFIPIQKKGDVKGCSNYHTIALISLAGKVMLEILHVRRQQNMNQEFPDIQAGLRKVRGTRSHIANISCIIEKAIEFLKKSSSASFCFIDYAKTFDCVDHNKLWKILKEMGLPDHLNLPPEKPVRWSRSNSWNQTGNNGLVQNWERSPSRLYIVTLFI